LELELKPKPTVFSGATTKRHDTRQPEKLLEFLHRIEAEIGIAPGNCRMFITGSGGNALSALIGAKFVQEVNAVALAVESSIPK